MMQRSWKNHVTPSAHKVPNLNVTTAMSIGPFLVALIVDSQSIGGSS